MHTLRHSYYTALLAFLTLPVLAHAQWTKGGGGPIDEFGNDITNFINDVITPFLFALALVLFIYGAVLFLIISGGDSEERDKGRRFMFWGIVSLVVVVSIWGIVNLIASGLGFDEQEDIDDFIPIAEEEG